MVPPDFVSIKTFVECNPLLVNDSVLHVYNNFCATCIYNNTFFKIIEGLTVYLLVTLYLINVDKINYWIRPIPLVTLIDAEAI